MVESVHRQYIRRNRRLRLAWCVVTAPEDGDLAEGETESFSGADGGFGRRNVLRREPATDGTVTEGRSRRRGEARRSGARTHEPGTRSTRRPSGRCPTGADALGIHHGYRRSSIARRAPKPSDVVHSEALVVAKKNAVTSTRSPRSLVRKEGVEPSRPFGHTDLNRARLPFRHFRWLSETNSSTVIFGASTGFSSIVLAGSPDKRVGHLEDLRPPFTLAEVCPFIQTVTVLRRIVRSVVTGDGCDRLTRGARSVPKVLARPDTIVVLYVCAAVVLVRDGLGGFQ